ISTLGYQLLPTNSLAEGAVWGAGRSLPEMSLAFALMAAINSSTGSRATLSRKPYEPAIHCEEVITGRACQRSPQRTLAIYPTEMRGGLPKFAYRSHRPIATLLADHKARGLRDSHRRCDRP